MKSLTKSWTALALLAVVALRPGVGFADVTAVIPDDALALVVVNDIVKTNDKIASLAKQFQIPIPDLLSTAKLMTGATQAIDEKRSFGFAVMLGENIDAPPSPLIFIPTTDYKTFIGQFNPDIADAKITKIVVAGETALAGKKGDYAVISPPQSKQALKQAIESENSISKTTTKLKTWIAENDVVAIATTAGINLVVTQGSEALQEAKKGFAELQDEGGDLAGLVAVFDIYQSLLESAGTEVTHAAIAGHIDKTGNLHIGSKTLFTPGGKFAKAGGQVKAPSEKSLAGLPAGPFVFAGSGIVPEQLVDSIMKLSFKMLESMPAAGGGGFTPEQTKRMLELSVDSLKGVRSVSMKVGVIEPGQSIYSSMTGAIQVDDSEAYLAAYEKISKESMKIGKESGNPLMQYDVTRIDLDGTSVLKFTVDMSDIFDGQPPEAAAAIKGLLGKDGKIDAYFAPAGKNTVAFAYNSTDNLKKVIAASSQATSLVDDQQIAKTAAMMSEGSQWVGFLSPQGLIQTGVNLYATFSGGQALPIPPFPETPPLGFGAKLSAEGVETEFVLPIETIKAGVHYAQQVQGLLGSQ